MADKKGKIEEEITNIFKELNKAFEMLSLSRDKVDYQYFEVDPLLGDGYLSWKDKPKEITDLFRELVDINYNKFDEKSKLIACNIACLLPILDLKFQGLIDLHVNKATIIAKRSRAKRKYPPNPNIEKAREMAIEIWSKRRSLALLDTAYEIKNKLKLREASTTIQEWIRDLNPNAKSKKPQ